MGNSKYHLAKDTRNVLISGCCSMTLLKKYGLSGGLRKFWELSREREYPITQLISIGFTESSGLLRGSVYGHVFR